MSAGEVAVSGIVVSGVLGPWLTSRVSRGNDRRAFTRSRYLEQRAELRSVLDEAAVLLSAGPRVLRRQAMRPSNADATRDAIEWSDRVYPLRERLVLRLPAQHDVVTRYDWVRTAAISLAEKATYERAVNVYETARDEFLSASRKALDAPIPEKQP